MRQWSPELAGAATSQIVGDVQFLHNTDTIQNITAIQQIVGDVRGKKCGRRERLGKTSHRSKQVAQRCSHDEGKDTCN